MENSSVARFTINTTREVFLYGDAHYMSMLESQTKNFYFLHPRPASAYTSFREDMHFVVAAVDFNNSLRLQDTARLFTGLTSPMVHKLMYAVSPEQVTQEHLLFAWELGCRHVFSGRNRNDDYKEYMKRICVESSETGSLTQLEEEIARARLSGSREALQKLADRIKAYPRESEDLNRLLAIVYAELKEFKKSESALKKILQVNPHNLWAANTLAKQYLRSGRAATGIEMLKKLGQFHELNSERLLTLGRALVVSGDNSGAKKEFEKGGALTGGKDQRFGEGLAMVKVAEGDFSGATAQLASGELSPDMISFLNLKAILASRQGRFAESIRYYEFALSGAGQSQETKAKLKFNMALAFVKTGELEKASALFRESLELGGKQFQRARRPLELVSTLMKKKEKLTEESRRDILGEDGEEWETLF